MNHWPIVSLGAIAEDLTALRTFDVMPDDEVVDPTISSATHTISAAGKKAGSEVKVRQRVRIEPGDLVFSRLHTQNGAFGFSSDRYQATSTFVPLRIRDDLVDRRYLFWALHKRVPSLSAIDTVGRETYKSEEILALEIPLPPRDEQERLAQVLDEVDTLLRLRDGANERTTELIRAVFDEMFGKPWLNEHGWNTTTLGHLGRVVTGNTPPRTNPEYFGGFVEWIKTNNIDAARGIVRRAAEGLSEIGAVRGRVVPSGAVLITCIAGSIERIGDATVVDREVAINQQINAIIPAPDVESVFLAQLVGVLKSVIQSHAAGVMTRIINKSALEKIPAICPPKTLQSIFGARVAEIRKLQDAQAASRERLDDLFQSVLHGTFQRQL